MSKAKGAFFSSYLVLLGLLSLSSGYIKTASGLVEQSPDAGVFFHHDPYHDGKEVDSEFSNEWVVHLEGSKNSADLIALKLGYENLGEVRA